MPFRADSLLPRINETLLIMFEETSCLVTTFNTNIGLPLAVRAVYTVKVRANAQVGAIAQIGVTAQVCDKKASLK